MKKYTCPKCCSTNTKPAESTGRICLECGMWF